MSSRVQPSRVQQFYKDKVILITGGTGFVGKALTEKLLRSCPNVGRIYLLLREKKGISPDERLRQLWQHPVFKRLSSEQPDFQERVSVVSGDLQKHRIGLSETQEALLRNNVDLVLHSAATVRFTEPLRTAVSTNVTSTKQLCQLAQQMNNLKAFVYVSTAFTNCDSPVIQERVYPPPLNPENLITLSEILEDPLLDRITPVLLGSKPNTYVYTKCVAEKVIDNFRSTVPTAIIRPSMVLSAKSEPEAGWIDHEQGQSVVAAGISRGLLRTMVTVDDADINTVPVDYVSNAVITLAYSVAEGTWQNSKDTPVVNLVSTSENGITTRENLDLVEKYVRRNPSQNLLWYPFITTPQSSWLGKVHQALLHHIPARVVDCVTAICGKPTKLRKINEQYDTFLKTIQFFCTHQFNFEEKNAQVMWDSLELQDQQLFPFNMATLDWDQLFSDYVKGCRKFLLKEDPSTIEKARNRLKILYIVHVATAATLLISPIAVISILSTSDLLANLNNVFTIF